MHEILYIHFIKEKTLTSTEESVSSCMTLTIAPFHNTFGVFVAIILELIIAQM